jgi:RNA polymerase sigma factor (TIGR02999 family)
MADDDSNSQTLSILLDETQSDTERVARLLPLVYDQLRAAAERALATERADHTLQATALVHEAYLRLVGDREMHWSGKAHFYVAAAEAMRRILLDHARSRGRLKRGGGRARLDLESVGDLAAGDAAGILGFDDLFRRLESEHPEAAAVVRLRFYAGLTIEQTARALGLSSNTVDRRWALARAWLFRETRAGDAQPGQDGASPA